MTVEYIIQNSGVEGQVVFTQDGFIWKNGVLNDSELNALIVSYCQQQNWDTLIITDKEEFINYNTGYWERHDLIATNFWEDELYNKILSFFNDLSNYLDNIRSEI